jgi:hypothetical protein
MLFIELTAISGLMVPVNAAQIFYIVESDQSGNSDIYFGRDDYLYVQESRREILDAIRLASQEG